MNLSTWAIKNPIPVTILFIFMVFAGVIGFQKLSINNFPDMDLPTVTVSVSLPGATPSQLETQITRKVEDSVANVSQIKHISSTLTDGSSTTTIEFELNKNLPDAVDEVKEAIDKVKSQFPAGTDEPQVAKVTMGSTSIITYEINASMDDIDLSWYVDNNINRLLSSVSGVSKITRKGGLEREIQVSLNPSKLLMLNTTINNVSNQLYNVRQDFSGGRVDIGGRENVIQTKPNLNNVNDIQQLYIPLANFSYIKLGEIADVKDTYAEVRQMSFLNGKPVITFDVYSTKGYSELGVANAVRKVINNYTKTHPSIKITEVSNSVSSIESTYDGSIQALYEGAILAVIVVWLFLRDWRATFVAATALPLSIIPTFVIIYWLGFSLNTITLLALTLVIGILVDDAIVEVENIVRHLKTNSSPIKAAIEAATEIGVAVIATSVTLVAVFLPTAFMGGVPGRIFKQFGWTASIAVLLSLLVARMLTPMMAAYMLKPQEEKPHGKIMNKYINAVSWCLDNPKKTLTCTSVFFVLSLSLIFFIPTTFFPAQDNNQVNLKIQLPAGSTIVDTSDVMNEIYKLTKGIPELRNVYATIGNGVEGSSSSTSGDSDVSIGNVTFNLVDSQKRKLSQSELEKIIQARIESIPGIKFAVSGGGMGSQYSLVITGEDSQLLSKVAREIEVELHENKNIGNISSSDNLTRPEISIDVNYNKAAQLGITTSSIGNVIRIATSGDYDNNLAKLNLPDRQIPIRVQLDKNYRQSLDNIANLRVSGNSGTVPLSSIAKISLTSGPTQIVRYDRNRSITFTIDLAGKTIGEVDKVIRNVNIVKNLPTGIHLVNSGDIERMQEMMGNFVTAMITGVFLIYSVLVLLFKDFKQPITILSALPLAVGGALGVLALFGYSLSMSTLIGVLMLMGIVTKNSILLVDYALIEIRKPNIDRKTAIIDACIKRSQPILMTTIAMIVGMIPIALGMEGDSSFRSPMALTVIGGLITSTALSLFVVPVVFELVDEMKIPFFKSKKFENNN